MNQRSHRPDNSDHFFLPDLCQSKAVLFLVLVAALVAIVLELAASGLPSFDWQHFSLKTLYIQWVVLCSAALLCAARPALSRQPKPLAVGLSFTLVLLVALLCELLAQWLLWPLGSLGIAHWQVDGWQLMQHLLITAVLTGITLRYFYLSHQLQLGRQLELQARIEALQARIRPHFLFNSMNSIASLIAVDPDAAETAVEDLAALFRASLNDSSTEVPLHDEIDLCQRYLRIEQQRLGERLQVHWQLNNLPAALTVPALILQPLVENAVYHGIQHLPHGGAVTISGECREGQLWLTVSNPLADPSQAHSGQQMAQHNINQRLQALYGQAASLQITVTEQAYCAQLRLPCQETQA
jgi:two-component system sensor histidine kinase AlgZ